jgi:hypothetical protein
MAPVIGRKHCGKYLRTRRSRRANSAFYNWHSLRYRFTLAFFVSALVFSMALFSTELGAQSYVVSNPNAVFVDVNQRRAALATYGAIGRGWTLVNPYAGLQSGLPTVSFSGAVVSLVESVFQNSQGQTQVNDLADVAFTNLTTSDGYSAAKFGVWFGQVYGTTTLFAQFKPSQDPNLANIPGLTVDLQFTGDPGSGAINVPPYGQFSQLDPTLQRTLLAIVAQLPQILQNNTQLIVGAAGGGRTLWSLASAITAAQQFDNLIFSTPAPMFPAVPTYTCDVTGAPYTSCVEDPQVTAFASYLADYGADYLATGDPGVAANLLNNLRTWAAGGSLLVYPGYDPNNPNDSDIRIIYNINDFLSPVLVNTWVMLRRDPSVTAVDSGLIEGWIDQLLGFTTAPSGGSSVTPFPPNNMGDLFASVLMAWGIDTNNNVNFAAGVQRYIYTLSQQTNPNGSFPLEVSRGACALRYQNTRIGNLVAIAEMAASQGYDLYSMSFNGVTLDTAIEFLLDATANPALVAGYTAQNGVCNLPTGSPIEISTYTVASGQYIGSAWIESYIARFPNTTLGQRLQYLITGGLNAARPLYNPNSGGLTTAFSAVPPALSGASLVAAVLPSSRSVQVGATATAFATIINSGSATANGCGLAPSTNTTSYFAYQTTDPTTNALTGTLSTPADIAAGQAQSFVFSLTPYGSFNPTTVALDFACTDANPAGSITGLDTLLLSASTAPVPDVVALAATAHNDGIVHVTGSPAQGAFAVATVNVGASGAITATANTGGATLPLTINLCQTNPSTGQCTTSIGPSVPTTINSNATPTFGVFATASGGVPFVPQTNRIFVEFSDATGTVRGSTSVAVETQ